MSDFCLGKIRHYLLFPTALLPLFLSLFLQYPQFLTLTLLFSMPPRKRYQWNGIEEDLEDNRPSRSQKKRESTALQQMGEELAVLSPSQLATMPISDSIRTALLEWQKLSSHEGKRRQMQYIGRLMREEGDAQAIQDALALLKLGHAGETASFKKLELLRDQLMQASPDELDTLLSPFPSEEKTLRDLVLRARNEREHNRPPHAFRSLFRKLRELNID